MLVARGPLPDTLSGTATVVYTTPGGEPRSAQAAFELPLSLCCHLVAPDAAHRSAAPFKLTLDTNQPPQSLAALFDDMVNHYNLHRSGGGENNPVTGAAAASVLCFRYNGATPSGLAEPADGAPPVDVTLLVSKSAGRYRVQSSSLPALWALTSALERRLRAWFGAGGGGGPSTAEGLVLSYAEDPPLRDFFSVVSRYLAILPGNCLFPETDQ